MKIVVQRVAKAQVAVGGKVVGKIRKGIFVLFGVAKGDTKEKALFLAEKLAKLRVMADNEGKMNLSVDDVGGSVLVVSQFTLYADTQGGNRPSFINAAEGQTARFCYQAFIEKLKSLGVKVETGRFGSYMSIEALLDGPVTIILEK